MSDKKKRLSLGSDGTLEERVVYEIPKSVREVSFTVLGDRVLIDPIPVKDTTVGGVILPETFQKDLVPKGVVIITGADVKTVKRGDLVMYPVESCMPTQIGGHTYMIVREYSIAGVYGSAEAMQNAV